MIVDEVVFGKAHSVFAVDPGETTGWAWALVGQHELVDRGVAGALERARKHKSGIQLADTRFLCGEVTSRRSAVGECEAVSRVGDILVVCREMAGRITNGEVNTVDTVVVEDFILREHTQTRDLLSPVRITAGLAVVVHQLPWTIRWMLQSPSDKAVINDDRLRKHGLWQVGEPHARDACRHLVLHLRRRVADQQRKG